MARRSFTTLLIVVSLAFAGAGLFVAWAAGDGCSEACQAEYADNVAACDAAWQQAMADLAAEREQCLADAGWDYMARLRCEVAYESGKDHAEADRNRCYNEASDELASCLADCSGSPSNP